jgi:hypothetical protein
MKFLRSMNKLPYLFVAAGLPFFVISCACLLVGGPLRYTNSWWLLVAVPLIALSAGLCLGVASLRKRGLRVGSTVSDLTEAMKREP